MVPNVENDEVLDSQEEKSDKPDNDDDTGLKEVDGKDASKTDSLTGHENPLEVEIDEVSKTDSLL
jgi:hypothetical protein